jgi:arylsulfatase A-like enzyme
VDSSLFRTVRPDYSGHGILNLMTTLANGLGVETGNCPALLSDCGLSIDEVARARHVVLLVIDGMGDALLRQHNASMMLRRQVATLTSVFPTTTASAIPTFLTGLAPQQHGLTGWHMYFDEIEDILAVLPLHVRDRAKERKPLELQSLPERLAFRPPLARRLPGRCTFITPRHISRSAFNQYHTAGERCLPFDNVGEFFTGIARAVAEAPEQPSAIPNFVHAYLPDLDALMHEQGTQTAAVAAAIGLLGEGLTWLVNALRQTGTLVIVTADHGFIDAPPSRLIEFEQHSALHSMLSRPLCGERRIAYAYVDHPRRADFEAYVATHLRHACELHAAKDFLAAGWLGPGAPHPRLERRIGDYVLQMREDWTIKDWLPGEKRYAQLGVHGGASVSEMHVPLLLARP